MSNPTNQPTKGHPVTVQSNNPAARDRERSPRPMPFLRLSRTPLAVLCLAVASFLAVSIKNQADPGTIAVPALGAVIAVAAARVVFIEFAMFRAAALRDNQLGRAAYLAAAVAVAGAGAAAVAATVAVVAMLVTAEWAELTLATPLVRDFSGAPGVAVIASEVCLAAAVWVAATWVWLRCSRTN